MTEKEQAVALANRVLDKPYIDPDGDICVLARQFLRAIERESELERQNKELTEALQKIRECKRAQTARGIAFKALRGAQRKD